MSYLIGMDMGTSSVKAILMTEDGKVQKVSRGAFDYTKLENGGVEISAEDYAKVCIDVIKELADSVCGDVKAICASSASGNLLVLDKENKPLTGIINWQDKRVGEEAREIFGYLDTNSFYRQIGWPFGFKDFPLAQMAYIKKNEPEKIKKAGKICMSTEYLYFLLTGKWGISTSAGTPFFFIDQEKKEYIPHLLETLGVSGDMFPPIMDAAKTLGTISAEMTEATGLNEGTPVVLGTFDHPSAARGVGVFKEGQVLLSCGTSWVALFPIEKREKVADAGLLIDPFLSSKGGCWAGMTSVPSISERIWLYVSNFIDDGKEAFSKLSALARESEKGAGGLVIDLRQEPDEDMISKYPQKHIARAIMEGTVNLLKENLDSLKEKGIGATEGIMVGGPSEDPYWIELIEDMCNIKLKVIHGQYAGAVGAATMAGIGCGLYESEEKAFELFNN